MRLRLSDNERYFLSSFSLLACSLKRWCGVGAFASLSVDLGSIPLSSCTERLENGIYSFPAWSSI